MPDFIPFIPLSAFYLMACKYCGNEISGNGIDLGSGHFAHDACCVECCVCKYPSWKNETRVCAGCGDVMCVTCHNMNPQHCG